MPKDKGLAPNISVSFGKKEDRVKELTKIDQLRN